MGRFTRFVADKVPLVREIAAVPTTLQRLLAEVRGVRTLLALRYKERLLDAPRYREPLRLQRFEGQIFSQNGEDGILAEIFARVGTSTRYFVEFGVENGLECNTTALLLQGWRGTWIECSDRLADEIEHAFADKLGDELTLRRALVTPENVESLFEGAGVPADLDLLSVDIDSDDYWVWQAIKRFRPRVVVVEYNAAYPPPIRWVKRKGSPLTRHQSTYFGASLASFEHLAREKGYSLVGCDLAGVNAFFVRADLCGDKFAAPFTAENHYEPARYHASGRIGHPRGFGPFDAV